MCDNAWSIGRKGAGRSDVLLEGETISGVHASLNYLAGKFYLIDNKSRNGSYLIRNKQKLNLSEYTEIFPSDIIVFGASEFSFDDMLNYSSKSKGRAITRLSIIESCQPIATTFIPEKLIQEKPTTQKVRCIDCMAVILADEICPSCRSNKHLERHR